jgi:tetratricopeptide (TPR) repeat protein
MAQSERADRGEGRERVSAPAAEPSASGSRPVIATSMGDGVEATDVVRADREQPRKTVPSAFAGLTFGRAAALVLVAALLGGAGGAYLAPKAKTAATSRARAELRFADGNRFYDAGRYDDALGAFRGALSIDPTFALAHRAKGAALAKLSRFDEAAEAYDEYLKLEQNAVDSTDVKAAIQRRRGPDAKP